MESEHNKDNEYLVYSDDDDNVSTVPEEDEAPYVQPDNPTTTRSSGRLSPKYAVSNIEPAIPVGYPNPEIVAPAETSTRRYPSRNRKTVKRLDPSHCLKEYYDNATIQCICMAQMIEKQEQK